MMIRSESVNTNCTDFQYDQPTPNSVIVKPKKLPRLRKLEQLIVYSYVDNLTFVTKIRFLNKATYNSVKNSYII